MDRESLPRIEFESNERLGVNVFDLNRERSLADLKKLGNGLRAGLRVLLIEPGELEVEAVLGFDAEWKTWFATADRSTIKSYY
jgi:hypothetical protein